MFTGIVESTGKVVLIVSGDQMKRLSVDASTLEKEISIGGSLSINGCCTTAVAFQNKIFVCELIEITLEKTNLGDLRSGDMVNLERPLKIGDELSGHIVQGHVDGMGIVETIEKIGDNHHIRISCPKELERYIVKTGSITLNGVSLTVANIDSNIFTVGIIPHTWNITNFSSLKIGQKVNIEVDILGKYIEKLIPSSISQK